MPVAMSTVADLTAPIERLKIQVMLGAIFTVSREPSRSVHNNR